MNYFCLPFFDKPKKIYKADIRSFDIVYFFNSV